MECTEINGLEEVRRPNSIGNCTDESSPYRRLAIGAKPAVVQSAVMKQPNTQRLRALRLSALARDNKVVNAIRSSITQAPDALVKELMDVHGWPAHEALCAVQQLQQEVLDDTAEQASA